MYRKGKKKWIQIHNALTLIRFPCSFPVSCLQSKAIQIVCRHTSFSASLRCFSQTHVLSLSESQLVLVAAYYSSHWDERINILYFLTLGFFFFPFFWDCKNAGDIFRLINSFLFWIISSGKILKSVTVRANTVGVTVDIYSYIAFLQKFTSLLVTASVIS